MSMIRRLPTLASLLFALLALACQSQAPAEQNTAKAAGTVADSTSKPAPATDVSTPEASIAAAEVTTAELPPADATATELAEPTPATRASAMADYGPLDPSLSALFMASPADPPAVELDAIKEENKNLHFMFTDELHHELFAPHIKDLGGGYVGIGTDQAFLYMGWQRPHLAWLIDYDAWVVWQHEAYFVFFRNAANPDELLAFFEDAEAGRAKLEEALANHPERKNIIDVYKESRGRVKWHLVKQRAALRKLDVPSFLTDQATYDFVRQLIVDGRVRTLVGNLLDKTAIIGIGEAATKLEVPIRVLYLSNAEQYWNYTDQFKANMLALPFDEKSVVLRTSATKPINEDYRYHVQPHTVFRAWLEDPNTTGVRNVSNRVRVDGPEHFPLTIDDNLPPAAP